MLPPTLFDNLTELPSLTDAGIAARQSGNVRAVEAISRHMQKFDKTQGAA